VIKIISKNTIYRLAILFAIIYVAQLMGYDMLRRLIYFPDTNVTKIDKEYLKARDFESFENRGYLRRHQEPEVVYMIFHGNAGHAAHRLYITEGLINEKAVLYLAEYPGYGERDGKPTEETLFQAALSDLKELQKEFPETPVILIGESLGSGVACWLSSQVMVSKLILISPFTSLVDVGKHHYFFLPVEALVPDRFESDLALANTGAHHASSLLVIHGTKDEVVPFSLGEKLYKSYAGPKKHVFLEGYGHNDLPWDQSDSALWQELKAFIK